MGIGGPPPPQSSQIVAHSPPRISIRFTFAFSIALHVSILTVKLDIVGQCCEFLGSSFYPFVNTGTKEGVYTGVHRKYQYIPQYILLQTTATARSVHDGNTITLYHLCIANQNAFNPWNCKTVMLRENEICHVSCIHYPLYFIA